MGLFQLKTLAVMQAVGKDADFEGKHPRETDGKFAAAQAARDVAYEKTTAALATGYAEDHQAAASAHREARNLWMDIPKSSVKVAQHKEQAESHSRKAAIAVRLNRHNPDAKPKTDLDFDKMKWGAGEVLTTKEVAEHLSISTPKAYKILSEAESAGLLDKYGYRVKGGWEDVSHSSHHTNSLGWQRADTSTPRS